ncbi:hypothetical protein HQ524_04175 [Candidatus Uhrbacteria bacterium]|nr:hypothetical protein [Candidatus Uhrbacteria bacterium]
MVDRMKKNLATFSKRDRKRLLEIMKRIIDGDMHGLDIKKLKGRNLAFRVRKANFRIIFAKQQNGDIRIIAIERRSESTYK